MCPKSPPCLADMALSFSDMAALLMCMEATIDTSSPRRKASTDEQGAQAVPAPGAPYHVFSSPLVSRQPLSC